MSFVGKILISLQLILGVAFVAFAGAVFAYQTSWRDEALKQKSALEAANNTIGQMQAESEAYKLELDRKLADEQGRAERAEAANRTLTADAAALRADTERLANDVQAQTALASISADEADARRSEALIQRQANNTLHDKLNSATAKIAELEDQVFNNEVERTLMLDRFNKLLDEAAYLRKVVRTNNLETDPSVYAALQEPPPVVEGLIVDIRPNRSGIIDFVTISLGENDGLLRGHRLSVYRSGLSTGEDPKYLGEVEIVLLEPNQAVGRVIDRAKNGVIGKGDNVTSKL